MPSFHLQSGLPAAVGLAGVRGWKWKEDQPGKEETPLGRAPSVTEHWALDGLGGVVSRTCLTSTLRLPLFRCLFMTLFCSFGVCRALALRHSSWIRISQVAPVAREGIPHSRCEPEPRCLLPWSVACLRWGVTLPRAGVRGEE